MSHHHSHRFDPAHVAKLESASRYDWLNPLAVADLFQLNGTETLAEYGCGTGFYTLELARRIPGGRMLALDISPEILEFFADKIRQMDAGSWEARGEADTGSAPDNIELILIDGLPTPTPDSSVDAILAINLLHELEGDWEALAEMRRVLRPGGRLIALDWLAMERPVGPPSDHCLDPERARALLSEAGFEIVEEPQHAKVAFPYHFTWILELT